MDNRGQPWTNNWKTTTNPQKHISNCLSTVVRGCPWLYFDLSDILAAYESLLILTIKNFILNYQRMSLSNPKTGRMTRKDTRERRTAYQRVVAREDQIPARRPARKIEEDYDVSGDIIFMQQPATTLPHENSLWVKTFDFWDATLSTRLDKDVRQARHFREYLNRILSRFEEKFPQRSLQFMSWTEDAGREARDALRSERELTKFKELSECFLFWFSVCRAPPRNLRLEDMGALYSCMPDFCTSLEEELKEEDLLDFFKKCIKYEDAKSRFDAQHQSKLLGQLRDKICEFFDLKHYDDMGNCERFQFMCAVVYFHHEVKGREHFLPGPATGMISPLEVQAAEPSIKSAPMIGKKRVSPEQPGELKQLTIDEQMADPRCLLKSANDAQPLKKREAKEEEKFQPMCKAVTDGGPVGWQDELAKKEEAPAPAPLVPVSLAPVPLPPARMFIGVPEEMSSQNMVSMPFQLLYESGRVVFVFRYRTMHKFNVNRAFERQGIKFGRECKPMFRYSGTWVTNAEEVTFKYATAAQITKETGADLSDLTKSLQNKVSGSCAAVVVKRGFKEIKSVMLKESVGVSNLIKGTANTIKKQLEEDKEDLKKYFKDEVTELMSEQISKAKDEVVDEVRALGKKVECLEKGMKDDRLELMEVIQSERDAHAEHNNKVLQAVESANQRGPATHEAFSFSGQEDAFSQPLAPLPTFRQEVCPSANMIAAPASALSSKELEELFLQKKSEEERIASAIAQKAKEEEKEREREEKKKLLQVLKEEEEALEKAKATREAIRAEKMEMMKKLMEEEEEAAAKEERQLKIANVQKQKMLMDQLEDQV